MYLIKTYYATRVQLRGTQHLEKYPLAMGLKGIVYGAYAGFGRCRRCEVEKVIIIRLLKAVSQGNLFMCAPPRDQAYA